MDSDKKRFNKSSNEVTTTLEIKKKKRKRANDKILRNIQLGPDARYYKLTVRNQHLIYFQKITNKNIFIKFQFFLYNNNIIH
jgi:hypothetical protein